jgi:hypothetical protein
LGNSPNATPNTARGGVGANITGKLTGAFLIKSVKINVGAKNEKSLEKIQTLVLQSGLMQLKQM